MFASYSIAHLSGNLGHDEQEEAGKQVIIKNGSPHYYRIRVLTGSFLCVFSRLC
jgi:hypothetical protein